LVDGGLLRWSGQYQALSSAASHRRRRRPEPAGRPLRPLPTRAAGVWSIGQTQADMALNLADGRTLEIEGDEWEANRVVLRDTAGNLVSEIGLPEHSQRPKRVQDRSARFVNFFTLTSGAPAVVVLFFPATEFACRLTADGRLALDWWEHR
jgi:hypothetical protein